MSEFAAKAKAHWTAEREAKVTGGKAWLVKPSQAPELLRALGLLNADATMSADAVRKFSQLNHMLALLKSVLADLASRHHVVRVLDACCGTSFVALAVAWLLRDSWGKTCEVYGIDSNPKVIEASTKRAAQLGYSEFVKFAVAPVGTDAWAALTASQASASDTPALRPHVLVALHACDTATDHALAAGIALKADVLAVAPCCHAELSAKWKDSEAKEHPLGVIFRTPNLRRETAAQMTDAMRLLLVRSRGYEVTATEFVPSEHTPKNRLLLGIRRGSYLKGASEEYRSMTAALTGAGIALEGLLPEAKV